MHYLLNLLIGFIALQHITFMLLEMFLWNKPIGLKIFRQSQGRANDSKVLAANQGLYNGFLALGLIWGIFYPVSETAYQFKLFFLVCVIAAGSFGGFTVNKSIFFIQAVPALLGICLLLFI
jgi:putative membrane protein